MFTLLIKREISRNRAVKFMQKERDARAKLLFCQS